MAFIELTKGIKVEVSDEDYEYLISWSWYAASKYRTNSDGIPEAPFPSRRFRDENGKLHQIAMRRIVAERIGMDIARSISHIDGNSLNCRRDNLKYRVYTPPVVSEVKNKHRKRGTGYEGITIHPSTGKYVATIKIIEERVTIKVGSYNTLEDAIEARACKIRQMKMNSEVN